LQLREHLRITFPERSYLTTFTSFGDLNSKTGSLTLRDLFVKMLMTIRGVSGEKAAEIVKVFPTPKALFDAYETLSSEEEQNDLLKGTIEAAGRKSIGPALSKKIRGIWYSDKY
jgi:crossover junction endonuclease MUS81